MKLNEQGVKNRAPWEAAGYSLPEFDRDAVRKNTLAHPEWIHFGAGNIFRAFQANVMQKLLNRGIAKTGLLVAEGFITPAGLSALEPYRARRAVFIAAGFGSRLAPITFNTPKPLVRVHGIRIIDRLIDACLKAGIDEIYIVRGYLSELFDQLLYKYPMVHFLENPAYNEANNISSALVARYLLPNAYVFEADLLISNHPQVSLYL